MQPFDFSEAGDKTRMERIIESNEAIVRWSVPATEPEGWFHEYVHNRYFARYIWRRVRLSREVKSNPEGTYSWNHDTFVDSEGKQQSLRQYSISGATLLDIANELNQKYIDNFLRKNIKEMTEYIHNPATQNSGVA